MDDLVQISNVPLKNENHPAVSSTVINIFSYENWDCENALGSSTVTLWLLYIQISAS